MATRHRGYPPTRVHAKLSGNTSASNYTAAEAWFQRMSCDSDWIISRMKACLDSMGWSGLYENCPTIKKAPVYDRDPWEYDGIYS